MEKGLVIALVEKALELLGGILKGLLEFFKKIWEGIKSLFGKKKESDVKINVEEKMVEEKIRMIQQE